MESVASHVVSLAVAADARLTRQRCFGLLVKHHMLLTAVFYATQQPCVQDRSDFVYLLLFSSIDEAHRAVRSEHNQKVLQSPIKLRVLS